MSRLLAPKNPAKTDIFAPIAPFQRSPIAAPRNIDENGGLPYKPPELSAMARLSPGAAHLGRKRPVWGGQHHRTYLNGLSSIQRQIARSAENYP